LAELVIVLVRAWFVVLDDLARARSAGSAGLLDAAEILALEGLGDGL
jgi:hypothetical protein